MLEPDNTNNAENTTSTAAQAPEPAVAAPPVKAPRKRAAKKAPTKAAGTVGTGVSSDLLEPASDTAQDSRDSQDSTAEPPPRKRAARKAAAKAVLPAEPGEDVAGTPAAETPVAGTPVAGTPAAQESQPAKKATRRRTPRKSTATADPGAAPMSPVDSTGAEASTPTAAPISATPGVLFMPPSEPVAAASVPAEPVPAEVDIAVAEDAEDQTAEPEDVREAAVEEATGARRRRRRGRRGRGAKAGEGDETYSETDRAADEIGAHSGADSAGDGAAVAETTDAEAADAEGADTTDSDGEPDGEGTGTKRRRRRRRSSGTGGASESGDEDAPTTVRKKDNDRDKQDDGGDGVRGVKGSTRLEAKRQRRRDGRETSRRRPPILTESEFLARREAVDRVMAVRQSGERTQIAVLEDDVLVEHYVTRASATSYVGNVYLGRVQNVLPSMEAAFVDIGKGRNGVIYAGEVNWDAAGLEGKSRNIESALSSGDVVLVQVTKDPIGHKGARLTSQVSLPGRFLVYVPGGGMTGISRKLPDTERHRLKAILKKIVPEDAGVIIRTAAEGASEEDLTRDVERLKSQWEKILKKAENTKAAPTLVHGEPDLAIRVVRDVFNEDFEKLVVQGDSAWQTVSDYVEGVAPDLGARVARHTSDTDLFHDLRVDEQLVKALDRKVWLPSGGSLVIDRTEAMTVIDVNTGKFVGAGGNLEQTVTRNNLEAAEEIVRQLRLRDVGGIVVIDFIDMVLESNRELVLRRLTECLGRDRTKHQVAEVTSLGLVQMTRKRVGEGLLEAFSEQCPTCNGRGVLVRSEPIDKSSSSSGEEDEHGRGKGKRGGRKPDKPEPEPAMNPEQRKAALAAMAAIHRAAHPEEYEDAPPLSADTDAVAAFLDGAAIDGELLDADAADIQPDAAEAQPELVQHDFGSPNGNAPAERESGQVAAPPAPRRRRAASRPAGPPIVAS